MAEERANIFQDGVILDEIEIEEMEQVVAPSILLTD